MQEEKSTLLDKLMKYGKQGFYPMHMPGHKRNPDFRMADPYQLDITEIDDFDDLHAAEGILKEGMEQAAGLYGVLESCYLVNGSSGGLLAAISAAAPYGSKALIARNSHISVYNAAYLRGLDLSYICPETDPETGLALGITAAQVDIALQKTDNIRLVVITSPTYEGMVSDIRGIAKTVHEHEAVLIVDEAHGAHLPFMPGREQGCRQKAGDDRGKPTAEPDCQRTLTSPESAVSQDADIIIHSLHKTLPAFTQTALLHRCSERISSEEINKYLRIYQTTSPSYLLMASIGQCLDFLGGQQDRFIEYGGLLGRFYQQAGKLRCLKVVHFGGKLQDPSKIVIFTENTRMTSRQLYDILRFRFKLQPEMFMPGFVLCMTSVGDTEEGFDRLSEALREIDDELAGDYGDSCTESAAAGGVHWEQDILASAPGEQSGKPVEPRQTSKPESGKPVEPRQTSLPESGMPVEPRQTSKPVSGMPVEPRQTSLPESGGTLEGSHQSSKPESGKPVEPRQTSLPESGGTLEGSHQSSLPESGKPVEPRQTSKPESGKPTSFHLPDRYCRLQEADRHSRVIKKLHDTAGFVSAEYVYVYPPGIPVLVPGENISCDIIEYLDKCKHMGLRVKGSIHPEADDIYVMDI